MRTLSTLVAALSLSGLVACDDDNTVPIVTADTGGAGGEGGGGDADVGGQGGGGAGGGDANVGGQGGGGAGGGDADLPDADVPDEGPPDLSLDMTIEDMSPPDMEIDAALPDMEVPPPPLDAGAACEEGTPCAEPDHICRAGVCRFDLTPQVYRMTVTEVVQPEFSAPVLQAVLNLAVAGNNLNLLFEAGGPVAGTADDSYWFIGNGINRQGAFDFNNALPIQNFVGQWFQTPERREWRVNGGETLFSLVVPTGTVELPDGSDALCYAEFATTVDVRIWPDFLEGVPVLRARTDGFLLRADAEQVEIRLNGETLRLVDFLADADLNVDTDADGIPDAYPFDLRVISEPVPFSGARFDGTNRDPDPEIVVPEQCAGGN